MSLFDYLKNFVERDRKKLLAFSVPASRVDRQLNQQQLTAGRHYVRLRVAEMYLRKDVEWFKTRYPAVHSLVRFDFGSQPVEIPNIADSSRVGLRESREGDRVARNFVLTPTVPFNGGIIELEAGLVSLEGQNNLKNLLGVLNNFAVLLNVTQLSTVLNIAQPLALGIQDLFGGGDNRTHLGYHDSFGAGELKDGYIAVVRASAGEVNPDSLWVVGDELRSGASAAGSKPFVGHDHMLLRVEIFEERDDWQNLASIQEPYREAIKALRDPATEARATDHLRTALLRAMDAPELTQVDRRRVIENLKEQFQQAKDDFIFKGLTGGSAPTLDLLMRHAMSIESALEQPTPRRAEIINATEPDRPRLPAANSITHKSWSLGLDASSVEESLASSYYFELRGDAAGGDRVLIGGECDLVFDYGVPGADALSAVIGKELDKARLEGHDLGVAVVGRGFDFRDGVWYRRATFKDGRLQSPVVFQLRATGDANAEAGLHIIFDRDGCLIYEYDISVQLVASFDDTAAMPREESVPLDLDELRDQIGADIRQSRDATLYFWAEGDTLRIQFHNHHSGELPAPPVMLAGLGRTMLANRVAELIPLLEPVASHTIWSLLADPLAAPGTDKEISAYRDCTERVITAGSRLYYDLAQDPDLKSVLESLGALPVGSRVTVLTNCAFLPWEILYPEDFDFEADAEEKMAHPAQPQNLFGNRLLIECLLMGVGAAWKPPLAIHRRAKPFVSFNLNPTIDESFMQAKYRPVEQQQAFYDALPGDLGKELLTSGAQIKKSLTARDSSATLIYLYCHGQNLRPFHQDQVEMLMLDEGVQLIPAQLNSRHAFAHGPLIFMNSCSSGAFSPLSFSSFLTRFREKKALGMLATTCSIPATFAAAFGQELIKRYLDGEKIGESLFDLRRTLLARGNPLGMFYSLQCHLDAQCQPEADADDR